MAMETLLVTVSSDDITRARVGRPGADIRLRDGSPAALRSQHGDCAASLAGGDGQERASALHADGDAATLALPITVGAAEAILQWEETTTQTVNGQ